MGRRREHEGAGFTLIELMVVVLILGILMAIAIPTFLVARVSAASRVTQTTLYNALIDEKGYFVTHQAYITQDATTTTFIDPGIQWGYPQTTSKNVVYAVAGPTSVGWSAGFGNPQALALAAWDGTKCWYIYDGAQAEGTTANPVPAGTSYAQGPPSGGLCQTAVAPVGAPTVGSAGSGTALTWYTTF